ncbi:unnamed protein product, partial [Ectocarpus sp. 12 AP-2014]
KLDAPICASLHPVYGRRDLMAASIVAAPSQISYFLNVPITSRYLGRLRPRVTQHIGKRLPWIRPLCCSFERLPPLRHSTSSPPRYVGYVLQLPGSFPDSARPCFSHTHPIIRHSTTILSHK